MKRWFVTVAAMLFCSAALRADVTIIQTTTVEGGMAAMAAQSGNNMSPKLTTRVKGMKSRTDIEAGPMTVSTIVDLDAKQVIILRPDMKTATIASSIPPAAQPSTTTATGSATTTATTTGPTVDASVKPTGKSQMIDGIKCDEYIFTTTMDMSTMAPAGAPPESAAMMRGLKMAMNGSLWVAKEVAGAEEYLAFQKAASAANMAGAAAGASGMNVPGMDKMAKAMASVNGFPYLTEMTMTIDGQGQMADMMKQMGPMKITNKVTSITTTAGADELFKIPEGYTVTKQN